MLRNFSLPKREEFWFGSKSHSSSWWFQPFWKICSSNWIIPSGRDENKQYLKPPPSLGFSFRIIEGTHCRNPLLCHVSWKKSNLMEEILHHLIGIVHPMIHRVCSFLFIPAGAGFLPPQQSRISTSQQISSGWWFQPTWKIWVKLDHFPNFRGKTSKNVWNHHLGIIPQKFDIDTNKLPFFYGKSPFPNHHYTVVPQSMATTPPKSFPP